ncbi:MAG: hypothetical protein OXR64_13190 [Chloroflexota bacterium]|nr:hypothetical protein [Chloroflexota bacterium]MDE2920784.1 hypothetical protein [Chloroflexota bacterium]
MSASPANHDGFLLMDRVESRHNVVRAVCQAKKHPLNPVLPLGDIQEWDSTHCAPWSSQSVIYDEEDKLFKAWYAGSDMGGASWWATGYAISEDGVNWHKPNLGMFEYKGSKKNNIVIEGRGPIIKDDAEPDPNKRFKGIKRLHSYVGEPAYSEHGARAIFSPDGINWTTGERILLPRWGGRPPDVGVLVRDDQDPDPSRRFKFVYQWMVNLDEPHLKQFSKRNPSQGRAKFLAYGPDIENFREADENPLISPNDGLEEEDHHVMMGPYGGAWIMAYEYGWYVPSDYGLYGMYGGDIRLAVSADGANFERVNPHQPTIPRGAHTEWDGGLLVISDKPVIKDGTIYLYYGGAAEDFTTWPPENFIPGVDYGGSGSGSGRVVRMGVATLREDGFTCLETPDRETPGHATTTPIEAEGLTNLTLNVGDVRQNRSWIEVEVLDSDSNEPLEGFTRQDSDDIFIDGLRRPVTWNGKTLAGLDTGQVKLRFWLYGAARLYAYGLS